MLIVITVRLINTNALIVNSYTCVICSEQFTLFHPTVNNSVLLKLNCVQDFTNPGEKQCDNYHLMCMCCFFVFFALLYIPICYARGCLIDFNAVIFSYKFAEKIFSSRHFLSTVC